MLIIAVRCPLPHSLSSKVFKESSLSFSLPWESRNHLGLEAPQLVELKALVVSLILP